MSTLLAVAYNDEYRAAEVLATLKRLQRDYLIDLDDAAYVTKGQDGKVNVHQSHALTGPGALGGGFWGLLFGLIFFVPILGLAVGAGIGALVGHYADYGIDKEFMDSIRKQMTPGSSAIFIMVRNSTPDKVIPEIAKYGGTVLQSNLSDDVEQKLQAALDEAQKQEAPTT